MGNFREFLKESNDHYYGVDSETEKRAAGIGTFGPGQFKNSKALKLAFKTMFKGKCRITAQSPSSLTIKEIQEEDYERLEKSVARFNKVYLYDWYIKQYPTFIAFYRGELDKSSDEYYKSLK